MVCALDISSLQQSLFFLCKYEIFLEYEYGSKLNWRKVAEHRSFMLEFASYFQQLKSDPALKKFRFDCQKAVNIPVNAIAGKGEHHTKVLSF